MNRNIKPLIAAAASGPLTREEAVNAFEILFEASDISLYAWNVSNTFYLSAKIGIWWNIYFHIYCVFDMMINNVKLRNTIDLYRIY